MSLDFSSFDSLFATLSYDLGAGTALNEVSFHLFLTLEALQATAILIATYLRKYTILQVIKAFVVRESLVACLNLTLEAVLL